MGRCAADENRQNILDAAAFRHSGSLLEIDNRDTRTTTATPKYQRLGYWPAVAVGFRSCSRVVGFLGISVEGNSEKI